MEFLREFGELERRLRILPRIESVLPPRAEPKREHIDWWLARHSDRRLPSVYVEFLTHYGGVAVPVPPRGIPLRPLSTLVAYQKRRDAIQETFEQPRVALSCSNIEGALWLWYNDDNDLNPRCALHGPTFETDSFAHYLWTELFAATSLYGAPCTSFCTVGERMSSASETTMRRFYESLSSQLETLGFTVLTFDSRRLTAERSGTSIGATIRGEHVTLCAGGEVASDMTRELDVVRHAGELAWSEVSARE